LPAKRVCVDNWRLSSCTASDPTTTESAADLGVVSGEQSPDAAERALARGPKVYAPFLVEVMLV
jgi:hypothetical protein